ncbi:MAG: low molecular weight phosphotyrosine protein phosphatase [Actinomycetales bacterium]|nr:low molecular weight phosphotyrosine protein phosphatase [Tetrasphaera sp.]NLW99293.1 low molecular weight phosphotyrosine protein phosphatase [Actinomycetales bacterium]
MTDSSDAYRIVVVCWGNICRSPMAEFVLRQAFEDAGLSDRVVVSSAGTSTEELGRPMDRRTIAVMQRNSVRDSGFRTKRAVQFRSDSFDDADLVLTADHIHERILRDRARSEEDRAKIRMLRSFDPEAVAAGTLGMDDPWYGDDDDFDITYAEIVAATPGIIEYVRSEIGA